MSKRLEDFIKANKEEFDDLEPKASLWLNIEERLPDEFIDAPKQKKTFSLGFVLRVAASVIILMSISFVFYLQKEKSNTASVNLAAINPQYAQQQKHYTKLISNKLNELKTITKSNPQLYVQFTAEIAKLDSTYKKLNNDLATSPNQELVLRAMIRNLQIQTDALSQELIIIEQFNQTKKQQQNETKNI